MEESSLLPGELCTCHVEKHRWHHSLDRPLLGTHFLNMLLFQMLHFGRERFTWLILKNLPIISQSMKICLLESGRYRSD